MPVINMQQKPGPLGQHENHKFTDVVNQVSSADCQQAKIAICHENLASAISVLLGAKSCRYIKLL